MHGIYWWKCNVDNHQWPFCFELYVNNEIKIVDGHRFLPNGT